MSHLLEMLGKGLNQGLEETLSRHFRTGGSASIQDLAKHAAEHPEHPDVQCKLGLAYLRAARLREAITHLSLACKVKPDYLPARIALASALEEMGQHDKALDHLRIANQTHLGDPAILFSIGYVLEKLEKSDEAAEYYRQVIAGKEDMLCARQRLAAIALFRDNLPEAIEQYRYLVTANPEDTNSLVMLAQLYHRNKEYALAIEHFERAIALEPDNWALVDDQVESLVADGQIRQAIDRLQEMLEEQSSFPDLHVRLADLYSHTGEDELALRHYHKALDLQPKYLEAKVKLGTHHLVQGRWEPAAEAFSEAGELNDQLLTAYIGLGVAQAAGGDNASALNSFDLAAAVEPNSSLLVREMARLQLKSALETQSDHDAEGFFADSDTEVEKRNLQSDDLLKLQMDRHAEEVAAHPGHADLRYRYGVLLRAEGKLSEALEQFNAAVEINPAYTQALIKKAVTHQDLGQTDEAVETYKRALELKPEYVDLHYRLGLLYADGKRFEESVRHMELAAKQAPENESIRANLALALQNMGLMDRAAATWRSLSKMYKVTAKTT